MAAGAPLSLRYHSDQLNNKVISLLREFYLTGEFCDVILHVGNIKISAHRIVLAAFSPYFRDLFHQPSSKNCTEITLRNHLREEAVRQLVDFCYSSDITVDTQSADKILTAANFLQIKEVEKLCITFLAAQQALRPEGGYKQQVSPVFVPVSAPTSSPTQDKRKGDISRELACADTSGIGSNNTSPRQSSRPSSVPSGNGSVIIQQLDDQDLEEVEVKKETEESMSDQQFFNPVSSLSSWSRPDYDRLRSTMSGYPGFFFPPVTGALSLPTTPTHHQLLMKALTQNAPGPTELGELYMGKFTGSSSSMIKDENASISTEEGGLSELSPSHQCHICLKIFQDITSLKSHMSEHREILSVPSASPYKMMSPVRKFSNQNSASQGQKESEEYGGSNMCGTCGKSFRDPQSLKFHRYNHVLRYQCNYCGKRFSRSWNLHRHRKTHYRQMQDSAFGSDDITVIDVDSDNKAELTAAYNIEKDKMISPISPYANYRNHRHDMMPFAFDMGKSAASSTYSIEDMREEKEEEETKSEREEEECYISKESENKRDLENEEDLHITDKCDDNEKDVE